MTFSARGRRFAARGRPDIASPAVALVLGLMGGVASAQDLGGRGLEEVVVTSSRIETPLRQIGAAVSVVTGKEIELRGYSAIADVLRTQPGVAVSGSGGAGKTTTLRIRGEDGYRTLVMIDGVKVADPTAPHVEPRFDHLMATTDLARIEILRGPQGFVYGADAGGVVNILTRSGEGRLGGRIGLELGAFATRKLEGNLSGGGDAGDYFVSVSDFRSDGFNARVSDTALADDDGYENTTLHAKLGWNVGDRARIQLVGRDIDARNEFDGCGFPTTYDCIARTRQSTYRLSADLRSGMATHAFAFGTGEVETENSAGGSSGFATDGRIARAEYTGSVEPAEGTTFVYGAELQSEEILTDGERRDRRQNGYYFEYLRRLDAAVFVSAGARYDDNDAFGTHTSARVSAAHVRDLPGGATMKYRASIGTGFRAPSLYEIAYNRGPSAFAPASGVALDEETTLGYDIGVEFFGAGGLMLGLTYFDQRIEDEIYFDLASFSGYLQAPGTSTSRGLEAEFAVPLGARWTLLGNLTYDETENSEGLRRIRRPETFGNVGLRYGSADDKLRLIANYRVSRDAVDEVFGAGRIPLDDYGILDVDAAYAFGDLVELYARVENLTNETYEEVVGYRTPGRTVAVGVRLGF